MRPSSRLLAAYPAFFLPFPPSVWLALEEKGIDYDSVLIDLYAKPDW